MAEKAQTFEEQDNLFKIIENRKLIPEMCGMFQYEVAERICENEGSKKYGIISVITQAFYETKLLFAIEHILHLEDLIFSLLHPK